MVQSEYYTTDPNAGSADDRPQAITDEMPTFVVFNGAMGSLTGDNAPQMQVGETMRIYFINAGLNLDSNFHPIGSHWDKVWEDGAPAEPAAARLADTLVPAGGGTVVELIGQVPQTIVLVDHALARAFDKGAIGQIVITATRTRRSSRPSAPSGSPGTDRCQRRRRVARPRRRRERHRPGRALRHRRAGRASCPARAHSRPTTRADEFADSEIPADYSVNVLMVAAGDDGHLDEQRSRHGPHGDRGRRLVRLGLPRDRARRSPTRSRRRARSSTSALRIRGCARASR